ncbi:hypothetical protein SEVIR_1G253150v4 [Setaria viridis]
MGGNLEATWSRAPHPSNQKTLTKTPSMANRTATDENATQTTELKSANRLGTEIGKIPEQHKPIATCANAPGTRRQPHTEPSTHGTPRRTKGTRSTSAPRRSPAAAGFGYIPEGSRVRGREGGGLRLLETTLAARGPLRWPLRPRCCTAAPLAHCLGFVCERSSEEDERRKKNKQDTLDADQMVKNFECAGC